MEPIDDHSGPYSAPVKLAMQHVQPAWIDYNGHMNVAYYTMAFDNAIDAFLQQELGMGEAHAARVNEGPYSLQNNVSYYAELLEGAGFSINVHLVEWCLAHLRTCSRPKRFPLQINATNTPLSLA